MDQPDNAPGRYNLPAPRTAFVGRQPEYAHLLDRLRDPTCRLITITGPGGAGKTRLALEAARALLPTAPGPTPFVHGVYLVPLAALSAQTPLEDALATTMATALGIALAGPEAPTAQVQAYLREKALLLVVDNAEHLLAGAPFLADLLEAAPRLTLLVTSRVRLRLRGEWVVELAGLPFPDAEHNSTEPELALYGAIQLFAQTAQSVDAAFTLTPAVLPAICRICQLVDGLPLAIELAASWTHVLSCDEIADEIAKNLDFLADALPDLPARQRSLRAVFEHSWNLLTPTEQTAFQQLAIFHASFTREAAGAIAAVPLAVLAALVDRSLLRRTASGDGHQGVRYEVSEVLRPYVRERLEAGGESSAVAARHAAYYLDLLAALKDAVRGRRQQEALAAISAEIAEIRAAWHWAVAQADLALLARGTEVLFHFYDMRSWFAEGAAAFAAASQVLATRQREVDAQVLRGKLLARQGWFTFHLGRQREAQALLEQSLTILRAAGAQDELVFTLNYLAAVCRYLGEYAATCRLCQESLAVAEAAGDAYGRAIACNILGQTAYDQGAYTEAQTWCRQSLAIDEQLGNRWSQAFSLTTLGKVAHALHAYTEARQLFEQSLQTRREMGDTRGMALCFIDLGTTAAALGTPTDAGASYAQSFALFQDIGNQWGMAEALIALGKLALSHARYAATTRLLQEALRLATQTQAVPQVVRIFAAFGQLLRHRGQAAWASELAQVGARGQDQPLAWQAQAERLLSWSDRDGVGAGPAAPDRDLTLDQAIAAAQAPVAQEEVAPRAAGAAAPARYPVGLTPREVEVLRLVAQGLTDAQVAEKLVLSPRTVTTHLTSIYGKLQVSSRSAATRFAVEQGLV